MRTYGSPTYKYGYRWVAGGSAVPYYNFNTSVGEPNGFPNERCVEMRGEYNHMWNNIRCDKRLNVICEVPIADSGSRST